MSGIESNPKLQAAIGKLVGDELRKMQAESGDFNPRGEQGEQIDKLTESLINNLVGGGQEAQTYDLLINGDEDLKYIVDRLLANKLIIPFVAKFLDSKLAKMTDELNDLFEKTFPNEQQETENT